MQPERAGLVSAVIIFKNEERFLAEAIESVRAQTYGAWELLLVDDGSDDGSARIASDAAAREPGRIRYLTHSSRANRGMSASRNLGASEARGEFVAFLDGDDAWLPRRLELGVAVLAEWPDAMMCYGTTKYWHSWQGAGATGTDRVQPHRFRANRLVEPPELLIRFLTHRAAIPTPTSLLIRRRAFDDVGGFEESFRGLAEDQAFLARFCLRKPVFVMNECLDHYRQHDRSCCAVAERNGEVVSGQRRFVNWLDGHLRDARCRDEGVWKALRYQEGTLDGKRRGRIRTMLTRVLDAAGIPV